MRNVVLVTRPGVVAAETAAWVGGRGFEPVVASLLEVRPVVARLPGVRGLQAVLVTSGNALAGVPVSHRGVRLLTVGDATAERARAAGFLEVRSASGDAAALVELAGRVCEPRGGALLLAVGRGQGAGLAADLRRRGFRVVRRVVYVSAPVVAFPEAAARALAEGRVASVLFFSAETARVFVRLLPAALRPALASVAALAIGRAAAQVLETLPWRHVRVAARPTQDELLSLL